MTQNCEEKRNLRTESLRLGLNHFNVALIKVSRTESRIDLEHIPNFHFKGRETRV